MPDTFLDSQLFLFDGEEGECIYIVRLVAYLMITLLIAFSSTLYLQCLSKHYRVMPVLKNHQLGDLGLRNHKASQKRIATNILIKNHLNKLCSIFKVGRFTSNLCNFWPKLPWLFFLVVPHLYPLLPQELLKPGEDILLTSIFIY